MGLDIYLTWYEDHAAAMALEERIEAKEEELYAVLRKEMKIADDSCPDALYEAQKKRLTEWKDREGIPRDLDDDASVKRDVSLNSAVYPEHMFKVGYCRSSYNAGGIERKLEDRTGKGLHYIFTGDQQKEPEYEFAPDWGASLVRAREALDALRAVAASEDGDFLVMKISMPMFGDPSEWAQSEKQALERFQKTRRETIAQDAARKAEDPERHAAQRKAFGWGSFSNREGEYRLDEPLEVAGILHGIEESITAKLHGQQQMLPCSFVIYRSRITGDDGKPQPWHTWYVQALEVVVEMCEWVLGQADPQKHYLRWSG